MLLGERLAHMPAEKGASASCDLLGELLDSRCEHACFLAQRSFSREAGGVSRLATSSSPPPGTPCEMPRRLASTLRGPLESRPASVGVGILGRAGDADSLQGVNVIFEVSGKLYPLNLPAATVTGENLRRKAAGQLGDEGVEGAREVADEIELVLVGSSSEPIRLARERADAVFYVLNVTDRPDDPEEADAHALYLAVREIHDERLRRK